MAPREVRERGHLRREDSGAGEGAAVYELAGDHVHRSEEHTSELQSPDHLACRLLLEKKRPPPATQLAAPQPRVAAPRPRQGPVIMPPARPSSPRPPSEASAAAPPPPLPLPPLMPPR